MSALNNGYLKESDKIDKLTDVHTFYDDVRKIVGYDTGKQWEDWQIKNLQRIADNKYNELLVKEYESNLWSLEHQKLSYKNGNAQTLLKTNDAWGIQLFYSDIEVLQEHYKTRLKELTGKDYDNNGDVIKTSIKDTEKLQKSIIEEPKKEDDDYER